MAELLARGKEEDLPPISEPMPIATAPIMSRLNQVAFTANQCPKSI